MKNKRILVIEDEFVIALDIMAALEAAGFRDVQQSSNEQDALRRIEQEIWDGIVADANLNGTSIERLATAMNEHSIPFVVVTGYGKDNLPQSIGNAPVIEKPFFGRHISEALVKLL